MLLHEPLQTVNNIKAWVNTGLLPVELAEKVVMPVYCESGDLLVLIILK